MSEELIIAVASHYMAGLCLHHIHYGWFDELQNIILIILVYLDIANTGDNHFYISVVLPYIDT